MPKICMYMKQSLFLENGNYTKKNIALIGTESRQEGVFLRMKKDWFCLFKIFQTVMVADFRSTVFHLRTAIIW